MKYSRSILVCFILLLGTKFQAQVNDTIMEKIREEYSFERKLKNNINTNPASHMGARKYSITTFSVMTEDHDTPNALQQKGKGKSVWGAETSTLQIPDSNTVVWGNASYTQGKNKQMLWNENDDYDLIYPYVAADSVGGTMKFENYSFSGGYAKRINSFTMGIAGSYKAGLSYRDIDPRPKNISAHFSLALGANKMMFDQFKIGAYLEAEKYTQKHDLSFVSNQGFPMIYNMTGLGNYNELLSGKLRQAYYEGWTYGGGIQIFEAANRNWYFNFGMKKLNLDKFLTEFTDLNASKIDEQQLNFSLGKIFDAGKIMWGLSADGSSMERKGTENLFLNDNSRNYIQIGALEKYNHKISNLLFKGLLQIGKEAKSSFIPFLGWIQEKEKYSNPLSIVEINRLVYGADYQWLKTFDPSLALSVGIGISMTDVYKKNSVFSSSGKVSINQMLQENYAFQSSDFWQARMDVKFHFSFPVIKNAFVGSKIIYSHFKSSSNMQFAMSIGSIF
ncbi:MAG: hypothetical protein MUW56_19885 [Chryseobacterium sp.]|uniref:DUF6850 family outer membrane beta-barrel protein n=1 Tax=Chryseobacterium sp. TaxID=1871047 RepID=UPI0025BC7AC1|nr:DUF6850 family outer membrane beta-barrel protein [Chryseobacterium sp.]MCJ7935820.1 hypothetical protein [Chryseobacterium sp.]